ncbi:MAG: RDD family protein [Flavobacteriaceae bacterium]|jgi:uncharacterized RDD family membrane protein YckC|nr:RDD family protein [Flavobacteriaceae bacterium]
MSQIAINTSQNVNVFFNTASVGERLAAYVIDMVIKIAYVFFILLVFFRWLKLGDYLYSLDKWSQNAIYILLFFPFFVYTIVCESLMEGQTFGKKAMKIKVVKIDGYQANFSDYLIRWVARLIDLDFLPVGLVFAIISKNNQRLGDMAAGTAVISLKNSVNISHTILENLQQDYVPAFAGVIALSDNDVRIIKENFRKAILTDDRQIIRRLSDKIKETLKLENHPKDYTERQFIDKIIKDYNFYTGKD